MVHGFSISTERTLQCMTKTYFGKTPDSTLFATREDELTFGAVTGSLTGESNQLRRSAKSRITGGPMPDISADQKVGCPGSVAIKSFNIYRISELII
jgi:hypothetical protein